VTKASYVEYVGDPRRGGLQLTLSRRTASKIREIVLWLE